jgi:regulator of protease activity HflC (stomatin/prohibitin superfamily)
MTDSPDNSQDQQSPAPELETTLDPAQQSVADALRFTFAILKLAFAVVLVFWLGSNIYNVGANETVVELRLGRINYNSSTDSNNEAGGLRWAWPYPFGDIVRIPSSTQEINLDNEFFIRPPVDGRTFTLDEIEARHQGPLAPDREGSLLTGDASLIHAKWTIEYRIVDAPDYLTHVGTIELAEQLVRAASEQSIVFNIARLPADDLIRSYVGAEGGGSQLDIIMQDINRSLEGMNSGLAVTKVLMRDPTLPMAVRRSYRESTAVISEQAQRIEQAQQQAATRLSETAGEATDELYRMTTDYQNALNGGDEAEIKALEDQIDAAMFGAPDEAGARRTTSRVRRTGEAYGNKLISGKVALTLNEAETYRNSIASRLNAEVAKFEAYQKQIADGGPAAEALLRSKLWEAARADILANKQIETLYLPDGGVQMTLQRDPNVRKAREQAALLQAEQAANN